MLSIERMRNQALNSALCTLMTGGRSSVVEFQPSKLAVVGSNPTARSRGRKTLFVKRVDQRNCLS